MNLEYWGETRIKHERVQPKKPNFCRLSLTANAVNFFKGRLVFTPEQVLEIINEQRTKKGMAKADPDIDTLNDEEIENFVRDHGEGIETTSLDGGQYLNLALLDELIDAGFIIAPDHQMLYTDPLEPLKNNLGYLPLDLVRRLVYKEEFNHQTFIEFYSFFIARAGNLEEGHMDMVFDVARVNGIDSVILANLASKGNEYLLSVPWNLFKNYLCFDWFGAAVNDINQLPDAEGMKKLMTEGTFETNGRDFFYASLEIYYPKDKKDLLDKVLHRIK
ncbi:hypothetical protein HYS10_00480 [Candidatus Collierbacteria bacterium]|nr:hypothetical protein [Candidatus Collierbacteria bacterium]